MRQLFFALLLLLLGSCSKNEFYMDFNLSEDITDNYNVVYYASDIQGGKTVQSVAPVMNGKCRLLGVTKLPTLIYITEKNATLPLVVYVEKGEKIILTGNGKNPLEWKVEGNIINEDFSKWRETNLEILTGGNREEINKIVAEFVKDNASKPLSLIMMLSYFDRRLDEFEYVTLMGGLTKISEKDKWLTMAARSDQYDFSLYYPARIKSFVARSITNYPDTITFSSNSPAIFFFWQNELNNKKELVDSMKILVKEFPDSNKRIIADINLDSDTIIWRNGIRRDSLKSTHRLWMPAGLADKDLLKLKVGNLPYYIVFDSLGLQQYRGGDIKEAVSQFRDLMTNNK